MAHRRLPAANTVRRRLQTEAETCEAATTDKATCEAVMRPNYAGERMCGYTDYAAQTGWPTDTSHARPWMTPSTHGLFRLSFLVKYMF